MNTFNFCHLWSICRLSVKLVCLLWFGALVARATDRYVATNGTDSGTCESWATAASNIQYAVDLAIVPNDTVWVSNGSYRITNQITITNKITLKSVNGYSNTLVYSDWPAHTTRCFYMTHTGVVDGFTISNGHLAGSNSWCGGGGAYLTNNAIIQNCYITRNVNSNAGYYGGGGGLFLCGNAIASNCFIISNTAYRTPNAGCSGYGGGIVSLEGQVLDCIITSNSAFQGAGMLTYYAGRTIVSNCLFSHNPAFDSSGIGSSGAGGALNFSGLGWVVNCVFSNNWAQLDGGGIKNGGVIRDCILVGNIANNGNGGGIYCYGGDSLVSNCVITGNSTRRGGGIFVDGLGYNNTVVGCRISNNFSNCGGGGLSITNCGQARNCLINNNTNIAAGNGGGVLLGNAAVFTNKPYGLINCTIVNNYSTNEGGGIATLGPSNYIANCIIAGNSSSSGNYPNVFNPGANMSNYYYSCAITTGTYLAENQGNITNDPAFLGVSNWRLAANSPCINTGTNISWMTNAYDLDGRARIRYGTVDMGAYECIYEGSIYKLW